MKYHSLAFTYKLHEPNAFKKNEIVLLRWKIQIPQEMIPVFPVFLVPHQTAVALAEEWMLVGVLLCSMSLLRLPLPRAVGIFVVLFSTSFESDTVWPFVTTQCYLWVCWCVALQYPHSCGARAAVCSSRAPLAFQHPSDVSPSTTTATIPCMTLVSFWLPGQVCEILVHFGATGFYLYGRDKHALSRKPALYCIFPN